jgi:predicted metal-dependent phosphotriesterase family hydrolase
MIVRTVLGDIEPAMLGVTYAHEHIIFDSPLVESRFADLHLHDVDAAVAELADCAAAGAGAMVDALPCAVGRDPLRLAAVSRASGLHVVAATGVHTERWYPGLSWANEAAAEDLADLFTADITDGIDRFDYRGPVVERTPHRAGIIKIGSMTAEPSSRDERAFAAAAETHHRTGAPILTHCEEGRGGLEQVTILSDAGVDPAHVILSHTDKVADVGYHRDLLATGVNVEYDQALRQGPEAEQGTARLVNEVIALGHIRQVMLGTDGARRSMWASLGGSPGLAWLLTDFPRMLEAHGVGPSAVAEMLVANPARVLAFAPRVAS